MKKYQSIAVVNLNINSSENFSNEVGKLIQKYQNKNMQVEIQYSTCIEGGSLINSALILAYTEE